jgi:23S rRNA (uracil1939-C5)-methyltransferase
VEGVAAIVRQAAYNASQNNLGNVRFFQHNLDEDVTRQPWATQGFNKVLRDPARAGAAGVMAHVVKLAPQRVVYVSCNPTTLARDSQTLLSAGYHLERVAMLDMFLIAVISNPWCCLAKHKRCPHRCGRRGYGCG